MSAELRYEDLVVDTNVLAHSNNPEFEDFEAAVAFLEALHTSTTLICVDIGASESESANRSAIMSEYHFHLSRSSPLAYHLVVTLFSQGRVKEVGTQVSEDRRKVINQCVADKSDRVFVKVACNSSERCVVSHDRAAFSNRAKKVLRNKCLVEVVEARDVVAIPES